MLWPSTVKINGKWVRGTGGLFFVVRRRNRDIASYTDGSRSARARPLSNAVRWLSGRKRRFAKTLPSVLGFLAFPRKSLRTQNLTRARELAGVGWNWLLMAGRRDRFWDRSAAEKTVTGVGSVSRLDQSSRE